MKDFWQGHETCFNYFVGVRKLEEQSLWSAKLFGLKKFWMKSSMKLERKVNRRPEMMKYFTSMKITLENLIHGHISMLCFMHTGFWMVH